MERLTLADRVYDAIRSRILSRSIAQGARLNIDSLASELGVSQTPVREALARLEEVGLVVSEPYIGSRVKLITPREITDIYQVRSVLEPLAIRLFVQVASGQDIELLRKLLQEEERAVACADDEPHRAHVSYSYHTLIADACGNAVLAEFIRQAVDRSEMFWAAARELYPEVASDRGWGLMRNKEHWRLLGALERRSADDALAVLMPHLDAITNRLARTVSDWDDPPGAGEERQ